MAKTMASLQAFLSLLPRAPKFPLPLPLLTPATQARSGEKARRKFFSSGEGAPGYRLSPDHFQKFKRMPAPDWAQKNLCIIVPNQRIASPEFFSCVRIRRLLSRHTCLVRSPRLCVQFARGNFPFLLS